MKRPSRLVLLRAFFLIGFAVGAITLCRDVGRKSLADRRANFVRRAERHGHLAAKFRGLLAEWPEVVAKAAREGRPTSPAEREEFESELRHVVDYHADLEMKYRRAAANPWMPVATDPPDPAPPLAFD